MQKLAVKRLLGPLAAVVVGSLAAVLVFELLLRAIGYSAPIWYRPDPKLGWTLRPHANGWFTQEGRASVRINAAGLRDRDHPVEKPRDVYRIAVLGDSHAEAMQVDVRDAFWAVLEAKLTQCAFKPGMRIEVINFGVSGFGTTQEYLMLQSTAIRYQPDLVLLAFTAGNDVRNNAKRLEPEKVRPFFRLGPHDLLTLDASFVEDPQFKSRASYLPEVLRSLSDRWRVLQLAHAAKNALAASRQPIDAQASDLRLGPAALAPRRDAEEEGAWSVTERLLAKEAGQDLAVLAPPRDAEWEAAWSLTDRIIEELSAYAKSHGSRVVLTPITLSAQVRPDRRFREQLQERLGVADLFYPERRMEALAKRAGIQTISLAREMQRIADAENVYFHGFPNSGIGVGHMNEKGHRVVANIIARELCGPRS